jgi:hypothetical protein
MASSLDLAMMDKLHEASPLPFLAIHFAALFNEGMHRTAAVRALQIGQRQCHAVSQLLQFFLHRSLSVSLFIPLFIHNVLRLLYKSSMGKNVLYNPPVVAPGQDGFMRLLFCFRFRLSGHPDDRRLGRQLPEHPCGSRGNDSHAGETGTKRLQWRPSHSSRSEEAGRPGWVMGLSTLVQKDDGRQQRHVAERVRQIPERQPVA